MGLDDLVYGEGQVSSRKSLGDVNLDQDAMEEVVRSDIYKGHNPEYVFGDCSEEELKAVIEYLDNELQKESPFGDAADSIVRRIREYREGLVEILKD